MAERPKCRYCETGLLVLNRPVRLVPTFLILSAICYQAWSQEDLLLEVNAKCGPWIFTKGGLNADYPYGRGDHLPPVVVKADGKLPFRNGELIQIQYLRKRARAVAWNYDNSCDSEGETLRLVNNFRGYTGNYMPSRYVPSSEYPVFLMALIGVFADEKGAMIGSPFKVGLHRTVQVPEGARQLQFGVNDDWFQTPPPNLGSYQIILKRLPQPNLVAPQQSDQEVDALLGEGGIGVTTHQMLGDCRIQSIVEGGPAEKEGTLKKDDVVLAVTDDFGNWIDVEEMKLPAIARQLRGAVGSDVRLRIMRPTDPNKRNFEIKIRREKLSNIKLSANERPRSSLQLEWKKKTGSSFWEAAVNRFNVPSRAVVEVKGPKAGLIRVTGDQPTSIYGTITSSNPVYVINPNGVVVGPGVTITNTNIGFSAHEIQISGYKGIDLVPDPVGCYHLAGNLDLITFLADEQREEIKSNLTKSIEKYIWLGANRIGGLSEIKEEQGSFGRNGTTIFPNNSQSATNPHQKP